MNTKNIPVEEQNLEPCKHMTDYVSAMSDGSLRGLAYWFTKFHLLHCRKCGNALTGFQALRARTLLLNDGAKKIETAAFTPDTRSALQKALDTMDETHA